MIRLPSQPSDSLEWDLSSISESGPLLWRLDLGCEEPFFPLHDEMRFQNLTLALTQFKEKIWPTFHDRTQGVVLYQGSADFSRHFSWKEDVPQDPHLRRIFCADAFTYYFQTLSYSLPDEIPIYLFLDASGLGSLSESHQIISKERFEHFQIAVKGLPHFHGLGWDMQKSCSFSHAICLPLQKECSKQVLYEMDQIFFSLKEPFHVISEAFLTEDWEGVEVLHVLKKTLSPLGVRKLRGFEAAGGKIIYYE